MLKRPHCIINYQQMRSSMNCSLMGLFALHEIIEGGRLLCGVLHDKMQKLPKDKLNDASLQK